MSPGQTGNSVLRFGTLAMKPPTARAESAARLLAMLSTAVSPCSAGALRPEKMFARFTTVAPAGFASGTLMISTRQSAVCALESGVVVVAPAGSRGERGGDDPDT